MKAARLAVLGIALGAGFLAWSMARNLGSGDDAPVIVEQSIETDQVLVAARPLTPGNALSTTDLSWQVWPSDSISEGMVRRSARPDAIDDLSGAVARGSFVEGEPIRASKVVKSGEGGYLSAVLPEGMQAASTRTSPQSGAGGFILPNDRVDVLVTRSQEGASSGAGYVTERILENVRVLAIDQTVEEQGGENVVIGNVATLELRPDQAEILALAGQLGDISLTLRSILDGAQDADGARTSRSSLAGGNSGSVSVVRFGVPSRVNAN